MQITKKEIEHVAKLARINFSEEEKEKFTNEFSGIIEFVNKLNEINTDGIEPTAHVLPIQNVFREDIVQESMDRDKVLQNAPLKEAGCFSVPKVVE